MFSVTLSQLVKEFELKVAASSGSPDDTLVTSANVNRPGLQLAGYFEHFDAKRIQIFGNVEIAYLSAMTPEERLSRLDSFFGRGFPCIVIARNLEPFAEMRVVSEKYKIPILVTSDETSRFLSGLIRYLNVQLAPRIILHGVLVEVYGEGILILGDSGVGKSETAMELVKRGHRLIADDVVEIRKVSDRTLLANGPDIIRHFIEIRGIGILDVKNLYGVGAVKTQENINLVMKFELWDKSKDYDRLGLKDEFTEILGIRIPLLTIPVRPGKNLAIIVEIAAMNNRQKKMGYNAAQFLTERISRETGRGEEG